jgi:putative aldouronate transport system substrate-binding protein
MLKTRFKQLGTLLTIAAVILGGCSKSGGESSSPAPGASVSPGATQTAPKLPEVELSFYYLTFSEQRDLQLVQDEVNKLLKEKINATVKLNALTWDNFIQKTNIMSAAGESFDMMWMANWMNSYVGNVTKGALLPLDELIDKHMPKTKQSLPKEMWDATRVNGKIYGVPNKQIYSAPKGIGIMKTYVDKYNVDMNSIKTYEDVIPIFEKIKKDHPDVLLGNMLIGDTPGLKFENLGDGFNQIRADDKQAKVFNVYESEEFKKLLKQNTEWNKKGWVDPRGALPGQDFGAEIKAGKYPIQLGKPIKPGVESDTKAQTGLDYVYKALETPLASTGSAQATLIGISKQSKNPDRSAMFLELINTDKQLYNLMTYGIENKHYKKVSDNLIEQVKDSGFDQSGISWMFGNQFNAYYKAKEDVGNWEKTEEINKATQYSPLMGFVFNQEPVKNEVAACNAVKDEFKNMFTGFGDVEKDYPKFIDKLKKAGIEKVTAEAQKQVDAFLAAKK